MSTKTIRNILASSLLLTVVGCGGNSQNNEIQLVNPFVGADGENFQTMVDQYNATNPEFTIRNVSMPGDAMYSQINSAYPTGQGIPELHAIHADFVQNYVSNDMLVAWNPITGDFPEINASNYLDAPWNIGSGSDGNQYAIPLDVHSWILYYNLDLIKEFGVEYILDDGIITYDEIREVAQIVQDSGSNIATYAITGSWLNYYSLYKQKGGLFTEDGINPTIHTPIGVDTFSTFHNLYADGFTNENGEDSGALFLTGQAIFFPEGIWWLNTANSIEDFEWGLTHTPQDNTHNVLNFSGSHQFVMFNSNERSPEKEQGVIAFVDWVRENSIEWARAGQNPAALAILDSPEYQAMPQSFLMKTEQGRNSISIDEYYYGGFVSSEISRVFYDVVFGTISIDEGLSSVQRAVEDMIAQARTE